VVEAAPGSARAVAIGAPFAVPAGARSRVIAAGEQARLEVAIDPADHPDHPALAAAIAASPLLALAADPATADVRLVARAGAWHVGDALHPVCTLAAHQLDRARAVLEHYLAYARPIRMAAQIAGAGGELGDGLALRVLLVPREVRALTEGATRSVSDVRGLLPEARSPGSGVYTLGAGETICFEVHNQTCVPLVVTLVNAAASGKVAVLAEHAISPGKRDLFWFRNQIFAPFAVTPPAGEAAGTDRVIAFGRAADQGSLGFLAVDHGFADVVRGHGAAPVVDPGPVRGDGGAAWTASQAVLHVQAD
ncbi:MAG TPA: hypothetical protein VFP84_29710, partial [Kofleriaceae bacterium]|nr:hypothetical protein [Kofleriaceae bacterium]